MIKKKQIFEFISLLIAIIIFILPSAAKSSDLIELKIWVDKEVYLTREPIFVHYEVKNRGDSLILLSFGLFGEYFEIRDEKGHSYTNMLTGEYPITDIIKSSESHKGKQNISSRYRIINPGEYNIVMKIPEGGILPVTQSNILKIKIKNPKGDEKKALELYLKAQELDWNKDKDPIKWEQSFYKYLELVDKYPQSVYAPMALYTALFKAYVIKDKNVVITVCKKLIENYPESYYMDEAFYNLIGNYKVLADKAVVMEYMKGLIKKYPNTKISEKAKYWFEKTEKEEYK